MQFEDGIDFANYLDNNDQLGHFRQKFHMNKNTIYMCGNSLGLASIDAEKGVLNIIKHWKEEGVKIWGVEDNKYYRYSEHLAKLMAPIVGVDADEVVFSGSTTMSIHQAISTFYKPTKNKYKILVDNINFPTDKYAIDSQVRLKGYDSKDAVKIVNCNNSFLEEDDIIEAMTEDVALVFLPTVYYKTAHVLDMKKITDAAKERGIIIGWDLCHAVGALEIDLKSLDIDFAVWCTYKYLNGGPGSPAAIYINRKHFYLQPGLIGWYGNKTETQFHLNQEFDQRYDANGWQIGSPHLFSMGTLEGALKMFLDAGMGNIRKNSLAKTEYLMFLADKKLTQHGFSIGNPRDDNKRGGHISLHHAEAYGISQALRARGVVPDFRGPDIIRLTPIALYTSYGEVYRLVDIILDIVKNETYKEFNTIRSLVV